MKALHWIELKQLDRATNFSSRTEIIKAGMKKNIRIYYYCSFAKNKEYHNLEGYIKYLGFFNNRYIKGIEFRILVLFEAINIIIKEKKNLIMVSNHLIIYMLPAIFLNKILKKDHRFIVDVRTTPVNPQTFDKDLKSFHLQFKYGVKYFDGFSFITPFMEKYLLEKYDNQYKSVIWSSGVDINLFNPKNYPNRKKSNHFSIFYHGGISVSRGNLDLIKACESLVHAGYNIELTQIGKLVNKSIQNYVDRNHIDNWCKILPALPINDIPRLIANCDLPVLPFPNFMGWRVSSPIKLMEYLAMGKKVLAPNIESFTDVFGKKSDLLYYYTPNENNEINSIKEAIESIIIKNTGNSKNYNPEIRKFVVENYTWSKQASRLFDFCFSLWDK